MSSEQSLPYHYEQLLQWSSESSSRFSPRLIVVPSIQIGYEVTTAMAAMSKGWLNIQAMPLKTVAVQYLEDAGQWNSALYVSPASVPFVVERILIEHRIGLNLPFGRAARALSRTIRDLRLGGVTAEQFDAAGEGLLHELTSRVYRLYLEDLDRGNRCDDAGLFERASRLLQSPNSQSVHEQIAIFDEVELSGAAYTFIRALSTKSKKNYRIGIESDRHLTSPLSASHRLGDWPVPDSGAGPEGPSTDILTAVGAENEIRAVFRAVVSRKLVFDTVELAYAGSDPYPLIARTLAHRYEIPVSIAAGMRALDTHAGAVTRAFLRWILDGRPVGGLIQMLRSGLIHIPGDENDSMTAAVTALLARCTISGDSSQYHSALAILRHATEATLPAVRGTFAETDVRKQLEAFDLIEERIWPFISLSDHLGERSTLAEIASMLRTLLHRYAFRETEQNDVDPTGDRLEFVAREELIARFDALSIQVDAELPRIVLLSRALDVVNEAVVFARAARPGKIHMVPLSSAGFSGRKHLFVVGLDNQSGGSELSEDPLFSDEDRLSLAEGTGSFLTTSRDGANTNRRMLLRARRRFSTSVTLVYSNYDIAQDRDKGPSSAVLSLDGSRRTSEIDRRVHSFRPDFLFPEVSQTLDTVDVILGINQSRAAQRLTDDRYPWMKNGVAASEFRSSAEWTVYDGLVGGASNALNPFSGNSRLSSSRLETLTRCPYKYFLSYVLKARVPNEKDPLVWVDAAEKGTLVHSALQRFVAESMKESYSFEPDQLQAHRDRLRMIFSDEIALLEAVSPAPNPATRERLIRDCDAVAGAFLVDETARRTFATPVAVEMGFGLWPYRKKLPEDSTDVFRLQIEDLSFNFQGRVDRVDRLDTGGYAITDYKNGSSGEFDERDLLDKGNRLQWALYAYAMEAILGGPVHVSGYLFPNEKELGRRVEADPGLVRSEVASLLRHAGLMAQSGTYVQSTDAQGVCRFCDYKRVCGDLTARKAQIEAKLANTRPDNLVYEALDGWPYADKKLNK